MADLRLYGSFPNLYSQTPIPKTERRRARPRVPSVGGGRLGPAPPLAPSRLHLLPTRRSCGKKLESRRTRAGALRMPSGPNWCRSLEGRIFLAARAGSLRPGSGRPGELSAFCGGILPSSLYRSVPGWRTGSLGLRVPRGPGLGERGRGRAAVLP